MLEGAFKMLKGPSLRLALFEVGGVILEVKGICPSELFEVWRGVLEAKGTSLSYFLLRFEGAL